MLPFLFGLDPENGLRLGARTLRNLIEASLENAVGEELGLWPVAGIAHNGVKEPIERLRSLRFLDRRIEIRPTIDQDLLLIDRHRPYDTAAVG